MSGHNEVGISLAKSYWPKRHQFDDCGQLYKYFRESTFRGKILFTPNLLLDRRNELFIFVLGSGISNQSRHTTHRYSSRTIDAQKLRTYSNNHTKQAIRYLPRNGSTFNPWTTQSNHFAVTLSIVLNHSVSDPNSNWLQPSGKVSSLGMDECAVLRAAIAATHTLMPLAGKMPSNNLCEMHSMRELCARTVDIFRHLWASCVSVSFVAFVAFAAWDALFNYRPARPGKCANDNALVENHKRRAGNRIARRRKTEKLGAAVLAELFAFSTESYGRK